MYIHTSQSQPTVIVSLKLNTHTYTLREYKLLGSTIFDGAHAERPTSDSQSLSKLCTHTG